MEVGYPLVILFVVIVVEPVAALVAVNDPDTFILPVISCSLSDFNLNFTLESVSPSILKSIVLLEPSALISADIVR